MRYLRSISELVSKGWRFLLDRDYRWQVRARRGSFDDMQDEEYLRCMWRAVMGYELNLVHPGTFNEKLQWLKLHDRRPEYTMMVDKYRVREYIQEKLGEEYLIPLLGVWDDPEDIDFEALPEQFVLKCNHNSGLGMCICTEKSRLNVGSVKEALCKGMAQDYYLTGREWPYKNVPRKIVAEKYMADESGIELKDYKIFCFNGEPKLIQVDFDRFKGHKRNLYSLDWQYIRGEIEYPSDPNHQIARPICLEEMLDAARILSKDIPHVRTDFYCINGQVYFGELTFYHGSGCEHMKPVELGKENGDWLILPEVVS